MPPFKTTEFKQLYNIIFKSTYKDDFFYIDEIMELLSNTNINSGWWIDAENYVINHNLLNHIQQLLFLYQITSQEIKL